MTTDQPQARHKTVLDDEARQVGRVYADALYQAAEKQNATDEVLEELESLVDGVFAQDPGLELFFGSASVGREQKAAALKSAFEGRANAVFIDFLNVLNAHDRLDMLVPIARAYRALHDRKSRKVVAEVTSVIPLTEEQRDRLRSDIRSLGEFEPVLKEHIDPDILGGLIVRVQDWVYDASLRTRLDTIRNHLVERVSHAVTSQ
jgi:F-type H+-transporting ATPase subunit delta